MIRVYGDIMLDRWIVGEANRMSPEAPVPVLLETNQEYSIGGAGNLALNIKSLGSQVELTSALGNDKEGFKLLELVEASKLEVTIAQDHKITTTKTRLVGQRGQHIVRWDREVPYVGDVSERFNNSIKKHDIVCISDYAKGTVKRVLLENYLIKILKYLLIPNKIVNFMMGHFL